MIKSLLIAILIIISSCKQKSDPFAHNYQSLLGNETLSENMKICYLSLFSKGQMSAYTYMILRNKIEITSNGYIPNLENPFDMGMELNSTFDILYHWYNVLENVKQDRIFIMDNINLMAQLSCWYDCMVLKYIDSRHDTISTYDHCAQYFYDNTLNLSQVLNVNIPHYSHKQVRQFFEEYNINHNDDEYCESVFFKNKTDEFETNIDDILNRISYNIGKIKATSYYIYMYALDFKARNHKVHPELAISKPRMIKIAKLLIQNNIIKEPKLRGALKQMDQFKSHNQDFIRNSVQVCILPLRDFMQGEKFLDKLL